ncbi:MAG: LacI family transcriptional regulator [Sulfobacillus benefaciens]|uniref:LacI family transcriptional regulator n=1 Tax=Sulfobacillus benefaciens TaxID=453960 RepID=A0A2T2X842_9FIRM|nr:MAG: LacI family transcriptional regulator [Sulfobacillus benefaciens]
MSSDKSLTPTIKDVAKLAKVSPATVSGVLSGNKRVSDISRQQVEWAIQQLGYRPNSVAQSLRTRRSQTVGLIIPDITNPFYADIAQGVVEQAHELGYGVFLVTAGETPEELMETAERMADRHVDGLILTSVGIDDSLPPWRLHNLPYVLVNRRTNMVNTDYVGVDNRAGAIEAVDYLVRLGHRKIAFLGGVENSSASRDRLEGFIASMQEHHYDIPAHFIRFAHLNYQEAYLHSQELMRSPLRPTAIFAGDDMMALGALQGLAEIGVRVPEEVSVVGFDGIWTTDLTGIQLTTVVQPRYELGSTALKLLHDRINGFDSDKRIKILDHHLAKRKTTGPVASPV